MSDTTEAPLHTLREIDRLRDLIYRLEEDLSESKETIRKLTEERDIRWLEAHKQNDEPRASVIQHWLLHATNVELTQTIRKRDIWKNRHAAATQSVERMQSQIDAACST
jgi:hypothetical protein